MGSRALIAASAVLGIAIGFPAGLARWSSAEIQTAIALGAFGAVILFIALPDLIRGGNRRR